MGVSVCVLLSKPVWAGRCGSRTLYGGSSSSSSGKAGLFSLVPAHQEGGRRTMASFHEIRAKKLNGDVVSETQAISLSLSLSPPLSLYLSLSLYRGYALANLESCWGVQLCTLCACVCVCAEPETKRFCICG